jgi:hypothetical protein
MTRRTHKGTPAALVLLFPLALGAAAGCATSVRRGADRTKDMRPADVDSLKSVGGKANALVVWTSSRAGLPHLFTMKSDGTDLAQLTEGKQTDWNPRFSPDGSKILFARSAASGYVGEGELGDRVWDLFTIAADGQSEPTKVVENGVWGSWISNDEILFMRGSKIMRAKLSGGDAEAGEKPEKKVMDVSKHAVFDGATARAPELSPDGQQIAMALTGSRRQVGVWNLKKKSWTQIGTGSVIVWAPDGSSVTWLSPTGKDLGEIRRLPLGAGAAPSKKDAGEKAEVDEEEEGEGEDKPVQAATLVDLQGKRSREASPRLSADGKWLVFGASIGTNEPVEDFEIYLWEVGSTESPTRLTFHSSSDRWPDIFAGAGGIQAEPKSDEAPQEEVAKPAEREPEAAPAKAAPETQEEPATSDAMPPSEDDAEPAAPGKSKGKPKAKAGKKKKR